MWGKFQNAGVKINVTGINIVGGLVGIIYFCNMVLLKDKI